MSRDFLLKRFFVVKDRLKKVREHLNISSQKEFANTLGWTIGRIQDLESGKVKELKASEAEKVQEKFLISGWWLLTGKGSMLEEKKQKDELVAEDPQSAKLLKAWQSLPAEKKEMHFHKIMGDALEHEVMSNPIHSARTATSSASQKIS